MLGVRIELVHLFEKSRLQLLIVKPIVIRAKACSFAVSQDDLNKLWALSLHGFQHFGITTELDQVIRLCRLRELRIPDFVKNRIGGGPYQKICIPGKWRPRQVCLKNNLTSLRHGLLSRLCCLFLVVPLDPAKLASLCFKLFHERCFVSDAGIGIELQLVAAFVRSHSVRKFAVQPVHPGSERRLHEACEVRGRKNNRSMLKVHPVLP